CSVVISTVSSECSTLTLHDALPISGLVGELAHEFQRGVKRALDGDDRGAVGERLGELSGGDAAGRNDHDGAKTAAGCVGGCGRTDRKSTRLNSSHVSISYAVFCLKK